MPQRRWNEVPKHHVVQHVSAQAGQQNPRWTCCYQDEDFMGFLKSVAESCLAGTRAHRAMVKILTKWGIGVGLRLRH